VKQVSAPRRFVVAWAFLTRLPGDRGTITDAELGRSLAAFPAVGLVLGALALAAGNLASSLLPGILPAIVVVAVLVVATGGLHLDGLADSFDALASTRDRERALEVMRDSRIGAFGAVALLLAVLAKVAALEPVLDGASALVLVAPAVSRWLAAVAVAAFPYARPSGLGRAFRDHGETSDVAVASVIVALALVLVPGGAVAALGASVGAAVAALGASVGAVVAALAFWAWASRRIGGLTGDLYGAGIEIAEVAFLCVTAAWCGGPA